MEQIADRLTEKIQTLSTDQLTGGEEFIESLQTWEHDRTLSRAAAPLSEPAFTSIWDNPEDDAYDAV